MQSREINWVLNRGVNLFRIGLTGPMTIVFLLLITVSSAQDTLSVTYKSLGFGFVVPAGWEGIEDKGKYLITHPDDAGFVIITSWPYGDIEVLEAGFNEGIKRKNGFFLAPAGQLKTIDNNRLEGKFSGLINHSPVLAYLVLLKGDQQQSVLIISAIAKENYTKKQEEIAGEIAAGFVFFQPEMPSIADEYNDMLSGKRLIHTSAPDVELSSNEPVGRNGFQDKIVIDLCANGVFGFSDSQKGNGAAFAVGKRIQSGQWVIKKNKKGQVILQLVFDDGAQVEYDIDYREGQVFLDGAPFFRSAIPTGNCR